MKEKIKEELQRMACSGSGPLDPAGRRGPLPPRLSCALARKVAEEAGITYGEVGRAADELRIKITDCELGCF